MRERKNFRKRSYEEEGGGGGQGDDTRTNDPRDEEKIRLALEEVKYLQKQRERKLGIPAIPSGVESAVGGLIAKKASEKKDGGGGAGGGGGGDNDKDDLVLQDTFAQETAVTVEDPNM